MYIIFFFLFQAEDGIRDLYVTGVQTCALPISRCGGDAVGAVRSHGGPRAKDVRSASSINLLGTMDCRPRATDVAWSGPDAQEHCVWCGVRGLGASDQARRARRPEPHAHCRDQARRAPRTRNKPPTVLSINVRAFGLRRKNACSRAAAAASTRDQINPVVMNVAPKARKATVLTRLFGSMNCGRKARKNKATLGFSRFVRIPWKKAALAPAEAGPCDDAAVFWAALASSSLTPR